jgi:APA family basic amino acid/polyamine antiporter
MAGPVVSSGLIVKQPSGLVRNVSITNALFFNIAAFVGTAIGWAVAFYALFPEWQGSGISAYAWMAVLAGLACFFLGLILSNLTAVMPRSGGDYVFTSRIISPLWGWLESWTLVGSALTIIGFEIIVALHNIQLTGILLGVAFPGSSFAASKDWFQDYTSKIIVGVIILLVIFGISILKTRIFYGGVKYLTIIAIISVLISFFGAFSIDPNLMNTALPKLGTSLQAIMSTAKAAHYVPGRPDFSLPGLINLAGLASVVLFQFIGFQFSSYIAGEVKGNIRRSVFFAIIGALIFAVFMNSLYIDTLGNRFGLDLTNAWGYLYWHDATAAPLHGQPPFTPVMATAVHPEAWPLWLVVALGNIIMNILLCPVYAIFLSRIVLAWAIDKQIPGWFRVVDDRTHAPLRVIVLAILLGAVFYALTIFGVLSLASTTFFSIALAALTWIMPGINAILISYRRPGPYRTAQPGEERASDFFGLINNKFLGLPRLVWSGILWLAFIIPVYVAAFFWPVIRGLKTSGFGYLGMSNSNGILWALIFIVVGIIIYYAMKFANKRAHISMDGIHQELPHE